MFVRVCVCVRVGFCAHVRAHARMSHLEEKQHGVCVVRAGRDIQQAVHQQDAHEVTHLLPGGMAPVFPLLLPRYSRGQLMRLATMLRKGTHNCI